MIIDNCLDSPPPSSFSSRVELVPETATGKEIEVIQHLFNTNSTSIQHSPNAELKENVQTDCEERSTDDEKFIQHITKDEGERGCVEQTQLDDVLQTQQTDNLFSITEKTSFPTSSFNQTLTSPQKAFTEKYQPVEVLNSEGEWVSGYWVHKCLVVANLEGIERKWALVDAYEAKYVFLGQIRLSNA